VRQQASATRDSASEVTSKEGVGPARDGTVTAKLEASVQSGGAAEARDASESDASAARSRSSRQPATMVPFAALARPLAPPQDDSAARHGECPPEADAAGVTASGGRLDSEGLRPGQAGGGCQLESEAAGSRGRFQVVGRQSVGRSRYTGLQVSGRDLDWHVPSQCELETGPSSPISVPLLPAASVPPLLTATSLRLEPLSAAAAEQLERAADPLSGPARGGHGTRP